MADPFESLRRPVRDTDPSPAFRARLIAELRQMSAAHHETGGAGDRTDRRIEHNEIQTDELSEAIMALTATEAPKRRWIPRRSGVFAAGVAAAVALVVTVVVVGGDDPSDLRLVDTTPASVPGETTTTGMPSPTSATERGAAIEPFDGSVESFPTEAYSSAVVIDGATVWVSHDSGQISRYDITTGASLGTVPIQNGTLAARPVVGFGSMWVATDLDDTLHRVDSQSGEIVASLKIPGNIRGLDYVGTSTAAVSEDAVWVVSFDPAGSKLYRIDPATNSISGSIPAPISANNVIYAEGSLWVLQVDGPLVRLDPTDGRELASIQMASYATLMRFGFGTLWVNDFSKVDLVKRIDPATNAVVASIPTRPGNGTYWRGDFAFAGGYAWTSSPDAALVKIDPTTNKIVARYGELAGGAGLAARDDAVWFTPWSGKELRRMPL